MKKNQYLGIVLTFFFVWQLITWFTIPPNELQKGFTKQLSQQSSGSDNIDDTRTPDKRIQLLVRE